MFEDRFDTAARPDDAQTGAVSELDVLGPGNAAELLCDYAVSDLDGDEIRDFRVTELGRLTENDTDVDGDGVPNVRDADPIDAARGHPARCGRGAFPAHLALACDGTTQWACRLQRRLYHDYDIVLINRDFPAADPQVMRSAAILFDAVDLVFGDNFPSHPAFDPTCRGLPTLKTLAFEQCATLRDGPWADAPETQSALCVSEENDWETSAEAQAHNAAIVFYTPGLTAPGLVALGAYVHELAHSWTFAYDFDPIRQRYLLEDNYWETPNYKAMLESLGWGIDDLEPQDIETRRGSDRRIVDASYEIIQFDKSTYTLNGIAVSTHLQVLDEEDIQNSSHARQHGLVGTYALSNPWEWYPEIVQAYLYRALEDHVVGRLSKRAGQRVRELLRARVVETWGNQAHYPNISDGIYRRFATEILPLSSDAIDELTCRYVIYSDDFLFEPLHESATPQGDRITLDELKRHVRAQWHDVCSGVARLPAVS